MIEPVMYIGIGFLVACMLVIGVIPLVHARAVRLTMRRVEAVTPMSMAEIQADKDQLRAEFAMATRRLEMTVEQMKAKTTSQLAEIGKKSEAIGRLKIELGEKAAALFALEAKDKQLTDDLTEVREQLAARETAFQELERKLAETQSQLAQATGNLHESSVNADSQRVELATLRAQAEVLKGQIESYEKETKDLHDRVGRQTAEAETSGQQLTEERAKAESLGNRVKELERQLLAQTTEAEILGRRVEELVGKVDEQGRFLTEREYAADLLRNETVAAQKKEADLRAEIAEAENRRRLTAEEIRGEKSLLENQLQQAQEERTKLQNEIATMRREAETAWANERMENAVLRERINDVAAEIARLTNILEGPGSPIDAILAGEAGRLRTAGNGGANGNGNGEKLAVSSGGEESRGSLADRIRALQSRASRVPRPS